MVLAELQALLQGLTSILSVEAVVLFDIGVVIVVAALFALLLKSLKQPLIPAYIAAGLLIGPIGLGLIENTELIRALSEIGIAFLLFFAGLEISLRRLRESALTSSVSGILQMAVLFFAGFLIALYFGFVRIEALYIGLVIAFSSTMVVIKLLHDNRQLNTLHGRIVLGILLIQDIAAIVALMVLPTLTEGVFAINAPVLVSSLVKVSAMILIAGFLSKTVLPLIFKFAARSSELLLVTAIGYCFLFIFASYLSGFSIIIGAFIAGVSLADLPYKIEIEGRIRPLRDFFATIFFVSLGMQLVLNGFQRLIVPALLLIILVLLLKPLVIMVLIRLMGYERRTSFLSGLSLAQMSEFSLILVAQGLLLGHVSSSFFSVVILGTIITMALTPYFVEYDQKFYKKLHYPLLFLEKLPTHKERLGYRSRDHKRIVILGCRRMGRIFLNSLDKDKVLVVDYDPEIIKDLMGEKVSCMYGDIGNTEILDKIEFGKVNMVISTVSEKEDNLFLINYIKITNSKALIFVTAEFIGDSLDLYNAGADYVMLPRLLGGEKGSSLLKRISKERKFALKMKGRHVKYLKKLHPILE